MVGRVYSLFAIHFLLLSPVLAEQDQLFGLLERMEKSYADIRDYTALFRKRERIDGEWQPGNWRISLSDAPSKGVCRVRFRFLDGVVSSSLDGQATVVTHVTFPESEDYLATPFHEALRVPCTIVLEAMAASGGRLIELASQNRAVGLMIKIDEANFIAPVAAGERMLVQSELLGMQDRDGAKVGLARTRCQALVEDRAVAEARIAFVCMPAKGLK